MHKQPIWETVFTSKDDEKLGTFTTSLFILSKYYCDPTKTVPELNATVQVSHACGTGWVTKSLKISECLTCKFLT